MGRYARRKPRPLKEYAIIDQETIDLIPTEIPPSGLTISQIKTDTDIADALTKKHTNSQDHSHTNKTTLDSYDQTNVNLSDAITKRHTSGGDQGLDSGGANAVTTDTDKDSLHA